MLQCKLSAASCGKKEGQGRDGYREVEQLGESTVFAGTEIQDEGGSGGCAADRFT